MTERRPHPGELEGYLEGVRHRIAALDPAASLSAELLAQWEEAQSAFRHGALARAERLLRAIDEVLDAGREEIEVFQRPRGLVGYRTTGEREVPVPSEEDPLANRLRLLSRLCALRASQGRGTEIARNALAEARSALERGDPASARRALDRALDDLEGPRPERPRRTGRADGEGTG